MEQALVKRTYSVVEAAQLIGIGKGRAYDLARSGKLPGCLEVGGRFLVSKKKLDAYLDGEAEQVGPAA